MDIKDTVGNVADVIADSIIPKSVITESPSPGRGGRGQWFRSCGRRRRRWQRLALKKLQPKR